MTKPYYPSLVSFLLFAFFVLLPASLSAQSGSFNFTTIDYPGAIVTSPDGLNDSGIVVGYYFAGDGVVHGFVDNGASITAFDYPGASATGPAGINNNGVITGYYNNGSGTHGFIDTNGNFSSFDCPGAVGLTNPHGINNSGVIVGVCNNGSGSHGFVNDHGSFSFLDYPGGYDTVIYGINDNGQMSGVYQDSPSGNTHGFFYSGGTFTSIDYPGASLTQAIGINNAGVVAGYGAAIGFLWNNGQFTQIQAPWTLAAYDINNNGQIVGIYYSGGEHGFLGNPINTQPLQFVAATPCRLVDTRDTGGAIAGGTSRNFNVPQLGGCNIPTTAEAYSLNVTVVPPGRLGYLTIWPAGQQQPVVSLMNSLDGRVKANAAIVPAGTSGAVSVYVSDTTDVLLDIDGYFVTPAASTLQFYPLTPCRVVDTRNANGDLGGPFLNAGQERDFPVEDSACLPHGVTPKAYSFNFTAVPHPAHQRLGYLSVWPKGESQPVVSTLNNPTGTVVANAALVPAGAGGAISVYPNNTTDLIIDINGYFADPGSGGLSLYTVTPCRVIDTRDGGGQPFSGERTVNVVSSPCAPSNTARAFVFNATAVPPGPLGYLTLWPDGENQPVVSTLNATDGAITSNMAIVPTTNGSIDAYASALTQLILDISSYFAP